MVAAAALAAAAAALGRLEAATEGLLVSREPVGAIPATVYRHAAAAPAPAVVIAHGFAGSQQLMQPFAVTLARNGYVAITFDFPGHGRNPAPLPGGLADRDARTAALAQALDAVARFARAAPGADGRIALLGHSMASDTVVRHARADAGVGATVAVSLFSREVTATAPRNLLVIVGALEPEALRRHGLEVAGMAAGGAAKPGVTYGRFDDGTARRLALAPGVEHIGVLYSAASLGEARDWLDRAFGRAGGGFVDARGPWLALLYLAIVALAWPLSALLPRVAAPPVGAGLGWQRLLPVALAPALLTPLILWRLPTDFLPLLLGDYLALHFGLYGLLTAAGLALAAPGGAAPRTPVHWRALGLAAAAAAAYAVAAIGLVTDRYAFSFLPGGARAPLALALFAGTLCYFAADEWLTRGAGAPRGACVVTRALFLASLAAAIALNLAKLFFLVIIVPAILVFFAVYGVMSGWVYRRTGHPLAGALACAAAFAWAIAATFPVVAR